MSAIRIPSDEEFLEEYNKILYPMKQFKTLAELLEFLDRWGLHCEWYEYDKIKIYCQSINSLGDSD